METRQNNANVRFNCDANINKFVEKCQYKRPAEYSFGSIEYVRVW